MVSGMVVSRGCALHLKVCFAPCFETLLPYTPCFNVIEMLDARELLSMAWAKVAIDWWNQKIFRPKHAFYLPCKGPLGEDKLL